MALDPDFVIAALRLPEGTDVDVTPGTSTGSRTDLVTVRRPGGDQRRLVARSYAGADGAANDAYVLDALARLHFVHAPAVVGFAAGTVFEEAPTGAPAISVAVGEADARHVALALASLHGSSLREGVRWELEAADLLPAGELPLFRLGFTSDERSAAREPVAALIADLRTAAVGPVHGSAFASNVFLGPSTATLVDFGLAGKGIQVFDVAAFALTSGLDATARGDFARAYAAARGAPIEGAADWLDAAGLLWGLEYLMDIPRREIELLGDDPALEWVRLMARRVSQGIQEDGGAHPAATSLRRALFPRRIAP